MKPKTKRGLEFYQTAKPKEGQWRWRIRGRNGLIIAASSESYSRRVKAVNNLKAIYRALQLNIFIA